MGGCGWLVKRRKRLRQSAPHRGWGGNQARVKKRYCGTARGGSWTERVNRLCWIWGPRNFQKLSALKKQGLVVHLSLRDAMVRH